MKKRVFSLFTSLLIIGTCYGSIPVSAGSGAPIGVPNNHWQLDGMQTMAKRILIGVDNDDPYFSNNDYSWNRLRSATTAVVSVTADYFQSVDTGWDATGSIVFGGSKTNWDQHDWNLGDGSRNEDGNDTNVENNISVSNDGKVWTIKYEDPEGIYKREEPNSNGYASICIQSFNEDTTKGWNIVGIALLDSNGKAIYSEGNVKYANNYYTFGDYEYMVYDNSVSIVGYNGNSKDIIIPSSINGYKVTEIANSAFEDCTTITSVNIPENVTIISGHAFANCYNLREVNLPRGLIHLSGYAFEDCSNIKKSNVR